MQNQRSMLLLVLALTALPETVFGAKPLVLILSTDNDEHHLLAESFKSELGLALDTFRVERRMVGDETFFSASEDRKIEMAGQLLNEAAATAIIWLDSTGDFVAGVGLYVSCANLHLARMVAFDSPIDFLPDVALITSGLIEHALDYGKEAGVAEQENSIDRKGEPEKGENGMGRRIPAPDGWLLVSRAPERTDDKDTLSAKDGVETEIVKEPTGESGSKDDAKTEEDDGEAQGGEESAAQSKGESEEESTEESAPNKKGDSAKTRSGNPSFRKFGINAFADLAQGISSFSGPGTWAGGGAELSLLLRPELFLHAAFIAEGGAFPRNRGDVSGVRLLFDFGAAYLFPLGILGLGPELLIGPCRTSITLKEPGYLPMDKKWWVFRIAVGPALRLPVNKRLSFNLKVLLSTYIRGERFIRSDEERSEVFKTSLLDLTARAGILLLI